MPLYFTKRLKLSSFNSNILYSEKCSFFLLISLLTHNGQKKAIAPPPDLMTLIFPILLNIVSVAILDVSIPQPLSQTLDQDHMKAYVTIGRHQLT